MIDASSTLEDVCFAVAAVLREIPVEAVLTGGSAATIYAPHAYTSADADFILRDEISSKDLGRALATIGFRPAAARGMFEHPLSTFTVDSPKGR